MSGRIPQSFVDELLRRIDIVELVDEYVPLKKQGRDFAACCPFHEEKTPSFTVSREKQFYYCFGCQQSGSAIGFLMEHRRLGFVEAIEELADRLGLEVPREGPAAAQTTDLRPIYELLEQASAFYQTQLRHHPAAGRAIEYLKGRGLSGETAAGFHLGFAPPGWDHLARALGGEEARERHLEEAGLCARRERDAGLYDRLRDRIVFPIHDARGRVVGFGGRVLDAGTPKYLNSPETPVFHKGRELYGLFQVQRRQRHAERLLVVEGYMDVVALAQNGVGYAVATLGTAVTRDHLEKLFRATRDIVFCFDGDEAGRRAAWRALETTLPMMRDGRNATFLFMPEGEDPDDFVRARGRAAFERAVAQAVPLSEFLLGRCAESVELDSLEGRSRFLERCRPLLASVPPGAYQDLLAQRLGEMARVAPEKLSTTLLGRGAARSSPLRAATGALSSNRAPGRPGGAGAAPSLVRRAIHLLLHHPELLAACDDVSRLCRNLSGLRLRGTPILLELLELLAKKPDLTSGGVLEHFREHEHAAHLARLAQSVPPVLSAGLEPELADLLGRLERAARLQADEDRLAELLEKTMLEAPEKEEMRRLLARRNP